MKMKYILLLAFIALFFVGCRLAESEKIDRLALVKRNSPVVNSFDKHSSLSVGNGEFAFTVDATGLQSFPAFYSDGVPLGTQAQWGWHSFENPEGYRFEETLKPYDFGRGKEELYAVQYNEKGRQQAAADWFRVNPHRLHLGTIGFAMYHVDGSLIDMNSISQINQSLDLWKGCINSSFQFDDYPVEVQTLCHPDRDQVAASVRSKAFTNEALEIVFRFPYPTGKHADDACDWGSPEKHKTQIISSEDYKVVLERVLDGTTYYITIEWEGKAKWNEKEPHHFTLLPLGEEFSFTCTYAPQFSEKTTETFADIQSKTNAFWQKFWEEGGVVDFSKCTDERAPELERRVVLSQYLMAIQSAGSLPPQETGLTYNSWFGKFHLEMHWWHGVHFALWNRPYLLERSLGWYASALPVAQEIAKRQGFEGARWMKMTDPSAKEAPSKVGSFLIWQQPHIIYMAELLYRSNPSKDVVEKYKELVFETARFMADFATFDEANNRYVLKGAIPAQETLRASETVNPPFELSYWHFALSVAQQWRERTGLPREDKWQKVIDQLSPLASLEGLYLAAETAPETYHDIRFTSDHMAVLGALGIMPKSRLVVDTIMLNTLHWVWDNWNWNKTWGWDYPMTAMSAARLGEPEKAVGALLMDKRTNTYLPNGHNYQDGRLRVYLPGNGGLLTAIAMMCAGWDGNTTKTPGFPKDGKWEVRWEGLKPMP